MSNPISIPLDVVQRFIKLKSILSDSSYSDYSKIESIQIMVIKYKDFLQVGNNLELPSFFLEEKYYSEGDVLSFSINFFTLIYKIKLKFCPYIYEKKIQIMEEIIDEFLDSVNAYPPNILQQKGGDIGFFSKTGK